MKLQIADYNLAESRAANKCGYSELSAFSTKTFEDHCFPTRVSDAHNDHPVPGQGNDGNLKTQALLTKLINIGWALLILFISSILQKLL